MHIEWGSRGPWFDSFPGGIFLHAWILPPSIQTPFWPPPFKIRGEGEIPLGLILASVKDACMPWAGLSPFPGFSCASVRCLQEALCWYNTRSRQGEEMDRDSSLGRRRRSWWMHGVRRCIPSSFLGTVIGQLCPLPPTKKSRRTGPGCMTRERERERENRYV